MLKRTFSYTHPVFNGFTLKIYITVFLVILISAQYGYCQKTISAGYGEFRSINNRTAFTGDIFLEQRTDTAKYNDVTFTVYYLDHRLSRKPDGVPYRYKEFRAFPGEGFDAPEQPGIVITPVSDSFEPVNNYYDYFVTTGNVRIDQISFMNNVNSLQGGLTKSLQKMFNAGYVRDLNKYLYEYLSGDFKNFDSPRISVRFSSNDWLIVDHFVLKKGVDYGYGYYIEEPVTSTGPLDYGEYLYKRETGKMFPLISPHLFSDASPVIITSNDTVYIYARVKVGKSYGHIEIYEISNGTVNTVFQGSGTGS